MDLMVLELAAAGIVFRRLLGFLEYFGIYRAERRWKGLPWAPLPTRPPLLHILGSQVVFWAEKNLQKVSLRLDSVLYGYSAK